jgi:hypothetical protein
MLGYRGAPVQRSLPPEPHEHREGLAGQSFSAAVVLRAAWAGARRIVVHIAEEPSAEISNLPIFMKLGGKASSAAKFSMIGGGAPLVGGRASAGSDSLARELRRCILDWRRKWRGRLWTKRTRIPGWIVYL